MESILGEFQFTKESKLLYELMVKNLLNNKTGEDELSLDKLTTQLNEQNMRIQKLQDLYVDGNIDNENYMLTLQRYEGIRRDLKDKIEALNVTDLTYGKWLKSGISV
ncbi:hypothetical protein, partial [Flavobacterium lacisediminis]